MDVKVTILVENTTPSPKITGEYGLAVLVNINNNSLLLDTGSGDALQTNANVMGIKLEQIEDVIISHGHFDHTGGMLPLLNKHTVKRVYAHPDIFLHRLLPLNNGKFKDIGCVFNARQLQDADVELIFTEKFTEIFPDVFVTGPIPRVTDYEDTGGNFKIEINGELLNDQLNDDMSLVINHPQGLIIISGCAHSGMINTISYALQQTGQKKVLAYIGGTHLMSAHQSRIDKTIQALKTYNIEKIIVGHCTGFNACATMYNQLGSAVVKGDAGSTFKFE